jgi:hypothetical protein
MTQETRARVEQATVRLEALGGLATLVPGGFLLTATHCIKWDSRGHMVLGVPFPQWARSASGARFRVGVAACEPVSDVAALQELDGQQFEDAGLFDEWCGNTAPVALSRLCLKTNESHTVWVLSHIGQWLTGVLTNNGLPGNQPLGSWWLRTNEPIQPGTSGGPVVTADGELLAVVSNFHESSEEQWGGMMPVPRLALPAWLLAQIDAATRESAQVTDRRPRAQKASKRKRH